MKGFSEEGWVVLGCWEGVEGGKGNKRGTISGEEERFWGGRREFGKGKGKVRVRVVSTIG